MQNGKIQIISLLSFVLSLLFLSVSVKTNNINLYLFMVALYYMKQIIIYIDPERNSEILDILNEHNVGGVAFYDVMGAGPVEHKPVQEMVRMYMTGKTIIPEHVKITKIETVVSDSIAQEIVDAILNSVQSEKDPQGIIFVKDVANAYIIGPKQSGEDAIRKR